MKRKQTFDEKNDLITLRPKKIIEQVKTFDGESSFIVPRKNTYIDKKSNTIVSLARDNSHSSVDTVGEYANAAAAPASAIGGATGGANLNYTVQVTPTTPTCQGIGINVNAGGATGGNILVGGQYSATNQSGQIVASQTITQNGKIFNLPLLTDASGTLLDANVVYTISLSYSDDNGSGVAQPVQTAISGQLNCNPTPPPTGGTGGGIKGAGAVGSYGTGATIIKNIPVVTIQNFNASSSLTQPDTISVNVIYQDGKAPYTVDYTITDPSGNVVVQKTNTTNSLQDSLQPSASGLSAGGYVVTVKVTGADGSSDTKTENVNVKGITKATSPIQGNLKINNLNVTTSNPTTSGFNVSTSWSDGTSPYQIVANIMSGGFSTTHQGSESSTSHNWTQNLINDASGNPVYGNYDVAVEVTDANGDKVTGSTSIYIQAPKASPLVGQLVATNIQNTTFDVDYKFANGVAPFKLTADLYYPADASGNSYKDTVSQSNLNNTGVFNQFILPDNGAIGGNGTIAEGYYKMTNCVVTDANGQTANLNDISPYLNGQKGTTPTPTPTPTPITTTTTITTGGGGIIGGGGGAEAPEEVAVAPKDKTGINWLLVIIALGVGYAIIRKKQ